MSWGCLSCGSERCAPKERRETRSLNFSCLHTTSSLPPSALLPHGIAPHRKSSVSSRRKRRDCSSAFVRPDHAQISGGALRQTTIPTVLSRHAHQGVIVSILHRKAAARRPEGRQRRCRHQRLHPVYQKSEKYVFCFCRRRVQPRAPASHPHSHTIREVRAFTGPSQSLQL